jgi:hypothetical protein
MLICTSTTILAPSIVIKKYCNCLKSKCSMFVVAENDLPTAMENRFRAEQVHTCISFHKKTAVLINISREVQDPHHDETFGVLVAGPSGAGAHLHIRRHRVHNV